MALTRQERLTIEETIKRIRKLEQQVASINSKISELENILNKMDLGTNMNDWTAEQWRSFLIPFIRAEVAKMPIKKHNHTNDSQGGDAFAELGARLVEEIDEEFIS